MLSVKQAGLTFYFVSREPINNKREYIIYNCRPTWFKRVQRSSKRNK